MSSSNDGSAQSASGLDKQKKDKAKTGPSSFASSKKSPDNNNNALPLPSKAKVVRIDSKTKKQPSSKKITDSKTKTPQSKKAASSRKLTGVGLTKLERELIAKLKSKTETKLGNSDFPIVGRTTNAKGAAKVNNKSPNKPKLIAKITSNETIIPFSSSQQQKSRQKQQKQNQILKPKQSSSCTLFSGEFTQSQHAKIFNILNSLSTRKTPSLSSSRATLTVATKLSAKDLPTALPKAFSNNLPLCVHNPLLRTQTSNRQQQQRQLPLGSQIITEHAAIVGQGQGKQQHHSSSTTTTTTTTATLPKQPKQKQPSTTKQQLISIQKKGTTPTITPKQKVLRTTTATTTTSRPQLPLNRTARNTAPSNQGNSKKSSLPKTISTDTTTPNSSSSSQTNQRKPQHKQLPSASRRKLTSSPTPPPPLPTKSSQRGLEAANTAALQVAPVAKRKQQQQQLPTQKQSLLPAASTTQTAAAAAAAAVPPSKRKQLPTQKQQPQQQKNLLPTQKQKSLAEQRRREARKETPITMAEVDMNEKEIEECKSLVMCFLSGMAEDDGDDDDDGGEEESSVVVGGEEREEKVTRGGRKRGYNDEDNTATTNSSMSYRSSMYMDGYQHDVNNYSVAYHYRAPPLKLRKK